MSGMSRSSTVRGRRHTLVIKACRGGSDCACPVKQSPSTLALHPTARFRDLAARRLRNCCLTSCLTQRKPPLYLWRRATHTCSWPSTDYWRRSSQAMTLHQEVTVLISYSAGFARASNAVSPIPTLARRKSRLKPAYRSDICRSCLQCEGGLAVTTSFHCVSNMPHA